MKKTEYKCEITLSEEGGLKKALASSPYKGHLQFEGEEDHYSCFVYFEPPWQLGENREVSVCFFWDELPKNYTGKEFLLFGIGQIGTGRLIM